MTHPVTDTSRPQWLGVGHTHCGLVKPSNQDAWYVDNARSVWIVADGMSGAPGGDVASHLAIATISASLTASSAHATMSLETHKTHLAQALRHGDEAIRREATRDPRLRGMGTTILVLRIVSTPSPQAVIGHLGDSRAYLWRPPQLRQLTQDHTLARKHVREGRLSSEEAAAHPDRHVLSRALGVGRECRPEVHTLPLESNDRLLLCTDGLTTMLPDETLLSLLNHFDSQPESLCQRLIEETNRRGGEDNVTVLYLSPSAPSATTFD